MTYGNAPAFTCVTFNNGVGWVGGYTYNAGPLLNVFGQYEIIGGSPAASGALAVTATCARPPLRAAVPGRRCLPRPDFTLPSLSHADASADWLIPLAPCPVSDTQTR